MTSSADSVGLLFDRIARQYEARPRVTRGKMLVSEGLRVDGHFFAALSHGRLLVKLPRQRVQELVDSGIAAPFEYGNNRRIMKEWALISPSARRRWKEFIEEAFAFVG